MFCLSQEQFNEFLKNRRIVGFSRLRYSIYLAIEKASKTHDIIQVRESRTGRKACCYVDFIQTEKVLYTEKQAMRLAVRFQLNLVGTSVAIEEPVTVYVERTQVCV